ncbi:MAG: threonine--tRNA ligase [Candidatus Yanofskybacteria bacterium CG10_big_fil_rev_8_21_14_0_10_36_16]|uniref:Threonine--tRNA ligase n=1 Tax=Candidatus Yanofskybacteria bacterium CG10_big_fil_rev_8_21_14_0_10_36_16 TaxID=1975096 RepID=A0A2J0QB01_9BACT|nr:MAG: threonine--tRNA ligase [Candidatus Yanofskybacteria bacterium CG10_big_fil_rev_8_21_14_0_10_36_16]
MDKNEKLQKLRHSLAHLLAAAILDLWPDTKQSIGPAIENGFYYDLDFKSPISENDLSKIEKKMREILKTWDKFEEIEVTAKEAKERFENNPYKIELIDDLEKKGEKITLYKSGAYIDLCRGGHIENAKNIKPDAFKITHMAGAYWRGDEKNKMLTRIYGMAFETKDELKKHLEMVEEAKKRDHKKLGPELDLFVFSELVGSGLPLFTPKGALMRDSLDNFVWELRKKHGYQRVDIPHITKKDLYEKSGHWDKFKDELFKVNTREGHEFAIKPMNCPHHTQIYDRKIHSYREMPVRYANTTKVYRDEQTGELAGLSRVRSITQDDAHVFCRYSQIDEEVNKIWDIIDEFYGAAGFKLQVRLSLHDPNNFEAYLGTPETWQKAEDQLRQAAKKRGVTTAEAKGEAAFYGPKIDFITKDSIGREWQVATIQLDMNMPERFDLSCVNENGERERVAMIHAAIMGAIERYMANLIEHFAGAFPLWLSPVQTIIANISESQLEYTKKIYEKFIENGIRAELNDQNETIGKKIRESEKQKTPYTIIIGEKEAKENKIAVRKRGGEDLGQIDPDEFLEKLKKEIKDKK